MYKRRRSFQKSTEDFLRVSPPSFSKLKQLSKTGEGITGTVREYVDETGQHMGVVKMVPFNDECLGTYLSPFRSEHAEPRMLQLLAKHVVSTDLSPHVVLPYGQHIVDSDTTISFMERAEHNDLRQFLAQHEHKDRVLMRVIIFQITFTLAVIHRLFPKFKHNDLHSENVMVRTCSDAGYTRYVYRNKTFYVPNLGFSCMIADFDFACISGLIDNYKVLEFYSASPGMNISYRQDHVGDLFFFLRTLKQDAVGCVSIFDELDIHYGELLYRSITRLPPDQLSQGITPLQLLESDFFAEFKMAPLAETVRHTFGNRYIDSLDAAFDLPSYIGTHQVELTRAVPIFGKTQRTKSGAYFATWPHAVGNKLSRKRRNTKPQKEIKVLRHVYQEMRLNGSDIDEFMRVVESKLNEAIAVYQHQLSAKWYLALGIMIFIDLTFDYVGKACCYDAQLYYYEDWIRQIGDRYTEEELLQFSLQWSWLK